LSSLLVKDADVLVTMDPDRRVIRGGSLYAEDGFVKAIGQSSDVDYSADRVVDASGHIVMPGLINCHHHLYQTLTRCIPTVQDEPLFEWLTGLYEIWREITLDAIGVSAKLGMAELLLSGCTTTSDQLYVFPQGETKLISDEVQSARELGIRFHPCRGSMSLGRSEGGLPPDDMVQDEKDILGYYDRLITKFHDPKPGAMTRIALGPCSPFSVTKELMVETRKLARKRGVLCHTHLAETLDEERYCLEKFGKRPLALMEELRWLGNDVWFAHGIHFNDDELELLARTGTGVAHCPTSNMRLGSGAARIMEMMERGVNVGLGVDGSASNDTSNIFQEVRNCLLLQRSRDIPGRMAATQALELGTLGGARLLGRDDIGSLELGKAADLVGIKLNRIDLAGSKHDPVAALAFCNVSKVDWSVVNGNIVVENGAIVGLDAEALVERHDAIAREMVSAAEKMTGMDFSTKVWRRAFK